MKNYFITKTKNGYRFYILHREGKKKRRRKRAQEEIGLELLYSDKYREK